MNSISAHPFKRPAGSKSPILISACLLGINCRYDGSANLSQTLINYLRARQLLPIPICPEQLGGLATPRPKSWFTNGDGHDYLKGAAQLRDETGYDSGPAFLRGAKQALQIARSTGCQSAILKQRSPSCGSRQIYRNGELVSGVGVSCALLQSAGLKVISEEDLDST